VTGNTHLYPRDADPNHITTDEAWVKAAGLLGTEENFAEVLRQFIAKEGNILMFGEARVVRDAAGCPRLPDNLCAESVHGQASDVKEKSSTEDCNYALAAMRSKLGNNSGEGQDRDNYEERIGLGYYMMDINAYRPEDLKEKGLYTWPVTGVLRPDQESPRR
jgi:hypothetical protein